MKITHIFLTLILIGGCNKNSTLELNKTNPDGGESTEGGGGSLQFYAFYTNNSDDDLQLSPTQEFFSPNENDLQYDYKAREENFYNSASNGISQLKLLVRRGYLKLNPNEVIALNKAHKLAQNKINLSWRKDLVDQGGTSTWALNHRASYSITLNSDKWMGNDSESDRKALCNAFVPEYDLSVFAFCLISLDVVIATHEFLSLVGLESDKNYRLSQLLLYTN